MLILELTFLSIRSNAASIYAYIDAWKIGLRCFV